MGEANGDVDILVLDQARCLSVEISSESNDYAFFQPSFDFTCKYFGCRGCEHNIELGREFIFPFKFTKLLGRGGFAPVFRGSFHRRDAAFKLIKIFPDDSSLSLAEYVAQFHWKRKGCHEYYQQSDAHRRHRLIVDKPFCCFFAKKNDDFYFVFVMPAHRMSLRQMMDKEKTQIPNCIKVEILCNIRDLWIHGDLDVHGDIKPDNILVDYNRGRNGRGPIKDFTFVVGDWGTSGYERAHFGGTPGYASPLTFVGCDAKDFFSFRRLAMALFFDKTIWLPLTYLPIEDKDELRRLRNLLPPFMKAIQESGVVKKPDNFASCLEFRKSIIEEIIDKASSYCPAELIERMSRIRFSASNVTLNLEHELLEEQMITATVLELQHADLIDKTETFVQTYENENSLLSNQMRSQGENSFACWAYSSATMLRTSCRILLDKCFELKIITARKKELLLKHLLEEEFHVELRNLIMYVLLPKKVHIDDSSQSAFLRAAVSRLTHETVLEPRGLVSLRPLWNWITGLYQSDYNSRMEPSIGLSDRELKIRYKKYVNHWKCEPEPDDSTIDEVADLKITPVGAVNIDGFSHVMVLDSISDEKFVFKNTHSDNRKVEIDVYDEAAPDAFYFIHISVKKSQLREPKAMQKSNSTAESTDSNPDAVQF